MKILIDLDSMVADLMTSWLVAINANHAEQHGTFTLSQVKSWNVGAHHPAGAQVFDYLKRKNFYANLRPIPGAIGALWNSKNWGHQHYVVGDLIKSATCEAEKREWVRQWLPWIPDERVFLLRGEELRKVHIARALNLDLALEDGPHHVTELFNAGIPSFCIGYEYNRHIKDQCALYVPPESHEYDLKRAWRQIESLLEHAQ